MEKPVQPRNPKTTWLTDVEVADMIGCHPQTLRNHRQQRKGIPYSKIGPKTVRYLLADVIEYMNAGRVNLAP